jgi:hypothetical protein
LAHASLFLVITHLTLLMSSITQISLWHLLLIVGRIHKWILRCGIMCCLYTHARILLYSGCQVSENGSK